MAMFGIDSAVLREEEYMSASQTPCHELAALSGRTNHSTTAAAAREYFLGDSGAYFSQNAVCRKLSGRTAEMLYGQELSLSATRAEKYFSCPYAHFLQSGLKLRPRIPAEFDAPAAGVFMHYVLESVSKEIKDTVGFDNADEELCRDLIARYIDRYVKDILFDFEGKNTRFVYLVRRLEEDVVRIVLDMLGELKNSSFQPLDFELELTELAPHLRGIVDRVDGWKNDGKLYLRVIDYKTGRKTFDLSNVIHGRDMQMLVYLFCLHKYGAARFGSETIPAGVLYVPARDVILKATRDKTEEELSKQREKELRRNGLVLDDPDVLDAMENSEVKRYLPVKQSKTGDITGDSLVSREQIGLLSMHVEKMLSGAVEEILSGGIECSPYYKSDNDNACLYCEFHTICAFDEGLGDKRRFIRKMKTGEVWEKLGENNE